MHLTEGNDEFWRQRSIWANTFPPNYPNVLSGLSVTDVAAFSLVFYWANDRVETHTREIQQDYFSLKEISIQLRLLLGRSPSYKIGFLRKSQMAKRGLLRVRYVLAESRTVAVSLLYLSMDRERDKV